MILALALVLTALCAVAFFAAAMPAAVLIRNIVWRRGPLLKDASAARRQDIVLMLFFLSWLLAVLGLHRLYALTSFYTGFWTVDQASDGWFAQWVLILLPTLGVLWCGLRLTNADDRMGRIRALVGLLCLGAIGIAVGVVGIIL